MIVIIMLLIEVLVVLVRVLMLVSGNLMFLYVCVVDFVVLLNRVCCVVKGRDVLCVLRFSVCVLRFVVFVLMLNRLFGSLVSFLIIFCSCFCSCVLCDIVVGVCCGWLVFCVDI